MKLFDVFDELDELRIDNKDGWGAVPYNQNVDYRGLRVMIRPSMFLRLAHKLDTPFSAGDIEKHIRADGAIAAPFMMIAMPQDWFEGDMTLPAEIYGHEGRNRMTAVLRAEGDEPVEVHLFFGGEIRNRHLTPEIVERLNRDVISQRGTLVKGPWFSMSRINEVYSNDMRREEDDAGTVRLNLINNVNGALDYAADSKSVYGRTPALDQVLDEHKDKILLWMENMLKNNVKDGVEAYSKVNRIVGHRWPEIRTWWEDHKDYILTTLLGLVKHGYVDTVYTMIDRHLGGYAGIKWPELDVIMRGCKSEIYRRARLNEAGLTDEEDARYSSAIKRNPWLIAEIPNPSEALQLLAVRRLADAIKHIKNPSEKVQLAAVTSDNSKISRNHAIEFIKDPSEAVQLAAVRTNGLSLQHIKGPSPAVIRAAIEQDSNAICYVADPSEELQVAAVTSNAWALQCIEDPSPAAIKAAILSHGSAIEIVKQPYPGMFDDPETKTAVIRTLLINMREGRPRFNDSMLAVLDKHGIQWPELTQIKKSNDAMKRETLNDPINEAQKMSRDHWDRYALTLRSYLGKEDLLDILGDLDAAVEDYGLEATPAILDAIEKNRDNIIRWMLSTLKKMPVDLADPLLSPALRSLSKIGIAWPELGIIAKSLRAEKRLGEAWSNKYKKSINCSNPKGFSQKAHCAARRKRAAGGKTKSKPVNEASNELSLTAKDRKILKNLEFAPELLSTVKNQSLPLQIAAVRMDGWAVLYLNDINPELWKDDKVKISLLQTLLTAVKEATLGDELIKVDLGVLWRKLVNIGCPYPELKIVKKSIKGTGMREGKVTLYTRPDYFGAEVDDSGFEGLPIANIPLNQLIGFEPDEKMQLPKSQANVKKILTGLKNGDSIPPILVRKHGNGYQVLDGHHRFWAYKVAKKGSIPARIISDDDIEEIKEATGSFDPARYAEQARKAIEIGWIDNVLERMVYGMSVGKIVSADPITEMLEENKDKIIKHLLTSIRKLRFDNVGKIIDMLRKMGIKWTELSAIEKSLAVKLGENFADGKGPGRPGDSRRHGIPKNATLAQLDKIGKGSGRKAQLARWQANMRRGKSKVKETRQMSPDHWKRYAGLLQKKLGEKDLLDTSGDIVAAVRDYGLEATPEITKAIKKHKRNIIRWMLTQMAELPIESVDYILSPILDSFAKLGIDWPELIMIRKSIELDLKAKIDLRNLTETIAPHGDPHNELKMMQAGTKPAALVNPWEFDKLYRPIIDGMGWEMIEYEIEGFDGHRFYVVAQPGEKDRARRIVQLVQRANQVVNRGGQLGPDYHRELGFLLGYKKEDIDHFIRNMFGEKSVAEGDVIGSKFSTKQAQKNKTPYRFNQEIADRIPMYDPKGRFGTYHKSGDLRHGDEIPFDRFEVVEKSNKVASIIGVAPDGKKYVVSTSPPELAHVLADAYNRGGFTDRDLQPVNMRTDENQQSIGAALTVFDIDETLFHTAAKIMVVKDGEIVKELDNKEFNTYLLEPGESFDFSQFTDAQFFHDTSVPIETMWKRAKSTLDSVGKRPGSRVIIVTARSDFDDKELFLNTFRKHGLDIDKIHVHRAGNLNLPSAAGKKKIIGQYLATGKFDMVRLFDDAESNLHSFLSLREEFPEIKFKAYMVLDDGSIQEYGV